MTFPRARLVVSALLFVGWLGFLFYLVLESWQTVVLSRPQLLVSDLCVIADIGADGAAPDPHIKVRELVWGEGEKDRKLEGQSILVPNLIDVGGAQGYRGPGTYIVPLTRQMVQKEPLYFVTAVPPMPGYSPPFYHVEVVRPGPNADGVAAAVAAFLGVSEAEARERLNQMPALVKKNVPAADATALAQKLHDLGAGVRLGPNDVRIYPANAHARQQLAEVAAERARP
jgi:hypothetical protein